jgi:signal peptidase I
MRRFAIESSRLSVIGALLWSVFAVVGCRQIAGLQAFTWQSVSMEKTIYKGESFLCNKRAYRTKTPDRGDVIVFQHKDSTLVKRVIGLPGDRVEGNNGVVTVNAEALVEPYAEHVGPEVDRANNFGPVVVAPGLLFVLGDNRDNSLDSRMDEFGEVKLTDVIGKAISIARSEHGRIGQEIR